MASGNGPAFAFVVHEIIDLGNRTVENRHGKTVIIHVQYEVLAHDRKPDKSDIAFLIRHCAYPPVKFL
jgi:hypothetical protein